MVPRAQERPRGGEAPEGPGGGGFTGAAAARVWLRSRARAPVLTLDLLAPLLGQLVHEGVAAAVIPAAFSGFVCV